MDLAVDEFMASLLRGLDLWGAVYRRIKLATRSRVFLPGTVCVLTVRCVFTRLMLVSLVDWWDVFFSHWW